LFSSDGEVMPMKQTFRTDYPLGVNSNFYYEIDHTGPNPRGSDYNWRIFDRRAGSAPIMTGSVIWIDLSEAKRICEGYINQIRAQQQQQQASDTLLEGYDPYENVDLEEEIRIQDLLSGGLTTQEQMQDDKGLEVDGGVLNTAGIFVVGVAKGTLMATVPIITISLAVGFMRRLVKLGAGVGE